MKYILTLTAFTLVFASCEKKNVYRCECVGKRSLVMAKYVEERESAEGGIPGCQALEDSLGKTRPEEMINCAYYNTAED